MIFFKAKFFAGVLFFSLFACRAIAFTGITEIDSLISLLAITEEDSGKAKLMNIIAEKYLRSGESEKAAIYIRHAESLSEKINYGPGTALALYNHGLLFLYVGELKNAEGYFNKCFAAYKNLGDVKGMANCYNNLGNIHTLQGNLPKALEYYNVSLSLREKTGDKKGIASCLNNIGAVYERQGNYQKSLENYFKSLNIREAVKDESGIATSLLNIGVIYERQGNLSVALDYYIKSLKIREQLGDKGQMASSMNNIGVIYEFQGDLSLAEEYYNKVLNIAEETGDKQLEAITLNYIGTINEKQGRLSHALDILNKSLKISETIGAKEEMLISLSKIGSVYMKMNEFEKAVKYKKKALDYSIETGILDEIKDNNEKLSSIFEMTGKYKDALKYYKDYTKAKDSLNVESSKKIIEQKEMKYQFDKEKLELKKEQEKKDAISREEKQKQRIIIFSVSICLILLFVFSLFIFNRFKVTSRQKGIIEKQKKIVEQKNKDIVDSINYAERIQNALLSNEEIWQNISNEYFILFRPKDVVSGDFYWAYSDHELAIWCAADCTGHGVPGAFMSLLGIGYLNEIVSISNQASPEKTLNILREKIIHSLEKHTATSAISGMEVKDGMDISLCALNKNNLLLEFSGANNPLWVARSDGSVYSITELSADKMPVGVHHGETRSFTKKALQLIPGDIIYSFTDGFADQFGGPKGKKFKYSRFRESLLTICHLPISEQKIKLEGIFNRWKGEQEQTDDVLIIGVKI